MGTHPIFESDFDCLTELKIGNVVSLNQNLIFRNEKKRTKEEHD